MCLKELNQFINRRKGPGAFFSLMSKLPKKKQIELSYSSMNKKPLINK